MTDVKINKIIAEFMGLTEQKLKQIDCTLDDFVCNYTESLDALLPVWEKMKNMSIEFELKHREACFYYDGIERIREVNCISLPQSAARVTAKVILETEGREIKITRSKLMNALYNAGYAGYAGYSPFHDQVAKELGF